VEWRFGLSRAWGGRENLRKGFTTEFAEWPQRSQRRGARPITCPSFFVGPRFLLRVTRAGKIGNTGGSLCYHGGPASFVRASRRWTLQIRATPRRRRKAAPTLAKGLQEDRASPSPTKQKRNHRSGTFVALGCKSPPFANFAKDGAPSSSFDQWHNERKKIRGGRVCRHRLRGAG